MAPYADDQIILVLFECELQVMVTKMNDYVKKRGVKLNSKTKFTVWCSKQARLNVTYIENVELVNEFVYLSRLLTNDVKHSRDIERRVNGARYCE
ncbi:hypothetical protein EVAR_7693_1 [Eumeta japonica]|uniref:Reverse transcriptase domain-containing protein n=1 Tax=Eumeta variegata TaxID=151549 RepID=A0A4C1TIC7_EUMVA|nr:hypothetical protein EVAR_7693_1 [Eumeta japonica]